MAVRNYRRTTVNRYPLFFKSSETIVVKNLLIKVRIESGRALLVKEGEEWWMNGVCPGGISAGGATPQEAYLKFCESTKQILEDIALDKSDFSSFETEVKQFIFDNDATEEAEWLQARDAIRNKEVQPEGPFNSLQRITTEPIVSVKFEILDVLNTFEVAADNQLAAAA
jgi:hypothetical protein